MGYLFLLNNLLGKYNRRNSRIDITQTCPEPNLTIGGESLALRLWANDNLQDELCHSTWHRALSQHVAPSFATARGTELCHSTWHQALSQHVAPSFATARGTESFGFIFANVQKVFFINVYFTIIPLCHDLLGFGPIIYSCATFASIMFSVLFLS